MRKYIKINDRITKEFLAVQLIDLLNDIEPFTKGLNWCIYELDAAVKPGGIPGYSVLIDKIDCSDSGYIIPWFKLKHLAEKLDQVIDLTLVASKEKKFEPYKNSKEWKNQYWIVIEILDGDYWEVYTSNEQLISLLESKYSVTEVYNIE